MYTQYTYYKSMQSRKFEIKCLAQRRSQKLSQCLNLKPLGFKPRPNIMLKIWLEILAKLLFDSSTHLVLLHCHHHPATTAQTLKPSSLA